MEKFVHSRSVSRRMMLMGTTWCKFFDTCIKGDSCAFAFTKEVEAVNFSGIEKNFWKEKPKCWVEKINK